MELNEEKKYTEKDLENARYRCIWCGKKITITKNSTAYVSHFKTSFGADEKGNGKMIWCKDCVNKQYTEYWHQFNGDLRKAIFSTCRKFDIPFTDHKFDMMASHVLKDDYGSEKAIGTYISKLFTIKTDENLKCFDDGLTDINTLYFESEDVAQTLEEKWGKGYDPEEYEAFEKKYNMLKNNYPERTSLHTEALLNYIRYRCKEELATAHKEVKEAKEWGALATKAAQDAKINPSQLSAADLQGGLNSFGEIAKVAEQDSDIIKKLPIFMYRPNDSADFILWCIINYMRKAKGLPEVDYHNIYSFYDRKRDEYIEQYGDPYEIFRDDPTIGNRENIEKFIKTSHGDDQDNG